MESLFNSLYKEYNQAILFFIMKMIPNKMDAEDLMMETFAKVWKALPNYKEQDCKISTWIYRIAKNHVIDFTRKRRFETLSLQSENSDGNEYIQVSSSDGDPLKKIIVNEIIDLVKDKLNSYEGLKKEIVKKYFVDQMKYDEIAIELNVPLGTVKNKVHLVKKDLKRDGLI